MRRFVAVVAVVCVLVGSPAGGMRRVRVPYPGGAPGMEAAIEQTWPPSLHRAALNVAHCESRGKPTARNGQYRGLFQMGRREWATYGEGDVFDAYDNAAGAFRLYADRGWTPWECAP